MDGEGDWIGGVDRKRGKRGWGGLEGVGGWVGQHKTFPCLSLSDCGRLICY